MPTKNLITHIYTNIICELLSNTPFGLCSGNTFMKLSIFCNLGALGFSKVSDNSSKFILSVSVQALPITSKQQFGRNLYYYDLLFVLLAVVCITSEFFLGFLVEHCVCVGGFTAIKCYTEHINFSRYLEK